MKASDRAYQALREDIVQWRLNPGAALGEVELGERLGLSRTPVREAVARLLADGLATQAGGRVVVSEVSAGAVAHLFELRQSLETTVARSAAARRPDAAPFLDLAARLDAAASGTFDEPTGYYLMAAELDALLDEAAANPYLAQALRQLRLHLERIRRSAHAHIDRLAASATEHAGIARAVASGDPDLAAAATVVHLHHSRAHIESHSGQVPATPDPAREPAA